MFLPETRSSWLLQGYLQMSRPRNSWWCRHISQHGRSNRHSGDWSVRQVYLLFALNNYWIETRWQVIGWVGFKLTTFRHSSKSDKRSSLKFVSLFLNQIFFFPDCPNGYIHLNNKCYRWQPPNEIEQHLKNCHNFRFEVDTICFSIFLYFKYKEFAG